MLINSGNQRFFSGITNKDVTLTFAAPDDKGRYPIRTMGVPDKKDTDAYVGTLHLVQSNLFLMVGAADIEKAQTSRFAVLPVCLLFRIQVEGSAMRMYEIDRKGLLKRLQSMPLSMVARDGAKDDDPITITSSTGDVEKFIRKCASEPDFFVAEPIFQLEKGEVAKK